MTIKYPVRIVLYGGDIGQKLSRETMAIDPNQSIIYVVIMIVLMGVNEVIKKEGIGESQGEILIVYSYLGAQ